MPRWSHRRCPGVRPLLRKNLPDREVRAHSGSSTRYITMTTTSAARTSTRPVVWLRSTLPLLQDVSIVVADADHTRRWSLIEAADATRASMCGPRAPTTGRDAV